jgi:hypothetical protein
VSKQQRLSFSLQPSAFLKLFSKQMSQSTKPFNSLYHYVVSIQFTLYICFRLLPNKNKNTSNICVYDTTKCHNKPDIFKTITYSLHYYLYRSLFIHHSFAPIHNKSPLLSPSIIGLLTRTPIPTLLDLPESIPVIAILLARLPLTLALSPSEDTTSD